ncbi:hypothetical protein RND81_05G119200 [Saponaria officinalis]|uniref:Uncharacterized protein n=1 Tax=Saponaria officinalis TaxID=3572 RepID=A0AAW1KS40_SAPOF
MRKISLPLQLQTSYPLHGRRPGPPSAEHRCSATTSAAFSSARRPSTRHLVIFIVFTSSINGHAIGLFDGNCPRLAIFSGFLTLHSSRRLKHFCLINYRIGACVQH